MFKQERNREGFTLLELMICVAVIGILASIAIPNYISYRERSKIAKALAELHYLSKGVTMLALDTGLWPNKAMAGTIPGSAEKWNLNTSNAGLTGTDGTFPDWAGPYISNVPQDPWGNNYFFDPDYQIDGLNYAVLGSFGPNGVGPNLYDADDIYIILDGSF